ncbi:hypothetical protein MPSEU_000658200 [Mayamaea pseudoterrestris]|nr:hypothetical protein MPSEU_000658200 [Mayamaea pseudoterrestris]
MASPFRIGMFGAGTVGGGVYELIKKHASSSIVITKICVRSLDKPRDFKIDETECEFVTDPNAILQDTNIDCVVEGMGGTTLAKTVVLEALAQKKAVVTANKTLLAADLDEIVKAAESTSTSIAMEAAVCGGIPIIHALQSCYAGDTIRSVSGIMNGTTNYMLCKMEEGADYGAVLQEAQDLGYAEADPTADVEGHDVRAKIALLAKLAFGQTVSESHIPCKGISKLQQADIEFARSIHSNIKLVGTASCSQGGKLFVHVTPTMVPRTHMLANISGAGNAVAIDSENMGLTSYAGPGAGRFPTANSVVADILRVAFGRANPLFSKQTNNLELDQDYQAAFYIRVPVNESDGIQVTVAELAKKHEVMVKSLSNAGHSAVILTEPCQVSQIDALCQALTKEASCVGEPVYMPVLI